MNRKTVLIVTLLLLAPMATIAATVRPATAVETLKVGVIGPYNLPQWHKELGGMEGGALLAMMDGYGKINVGGTEYQVELVFADEHAYPLDENAAYASAMSLCEQGCRFIIGGFRTEVTWKIIQAIKDWNDAHPGQEVIYFINGASTDQLISETVGKDYAGYKWLFRVNPINSTMLAKNVFGPLADHLIPKILLPLYGAPVKVGCLTEDLAWTQGICYFVMNILPTLFPPGVVQSVYCGRTPSGTTDFDPYLQQASAAGVKVLVTAYTLPDAKYLVQDWTDGKYPFLLFGIDVYGQQSNWPDLTGGKCEYECTEDFAGTRTPITPLAVQFWDHYVGNFSATPIYTAWGAYNGFMVLKKALETAGTLDPATVIATLEAQETLVLNGKSKFTSTHDVFSNEYGSTWTQGYTRAFMVQWLNIGGKFVKAVVYPADQPYSRRLVLPPWMYPIYLYDLNLDKKVDMKDIILAIGAFGATPGDPRWNFGFADVNLDGKVDMKDIIIVIGKFGTIGQPQ